jgi:hypothetical protein
MGRVLSGLPWTPHLYGPDGSQALPPHSAPIKRPFMCILSAHRCLLFAPVSHHHAVLFFCYCSTPWTTNLIVILFPCVGQGVPPHLGAALGAIKASSLALEQHSVVLHCRRHPLLGKPLLRWIPWSWHCCNTLLTLSSLRRINQGLLRLPHRRPLLKLSHLFSEPPPRCRPSSSVRA